MFTEIETDVLLEEIAQGDELYESDANRAIDIWYSVFLKIANESKAMKSTYLYAGIRDYWKAMEISGWFDDLGVGFLLVRTQSGEGAGRVLQNYDE